MAPYKTYYDIPFICTNLANKRTSPEDDLGIRSKYWRPRKAGRNVRTVEPPEPSTKDDILLILAIFWWIQMEQCLRFVLVTVQLS